MKKRVKLNIDKELDSFADLTFLARLEKENPAKYGSILADKTLNEEKLSKIVAEARSSEIIKKQRQRVKIHCLTRKPGDQTFFFTKDKKHCLSIEYHSEWDFGKESPSGARLYEIEIHTNNEFNFNDNHREISLDEVPECIRELLSYLK